MNGKTESKWGLKKIRVLSIKITNLKYASKSNDSQSLLVVRKDVFVTTIGSRVKNYTSRTTVAGEITQGRGGGESMLLKVTPGMRIPKEALHK